MVSVVVVVVVCCWEGLIDARERKKAQTTLILTLTIEARECFV